MFFYSCVVHYDMVQVDQDRFPYLLGEDPVHHDRNMAAAFTSPNDRSLA